MASTIDLEAVRALAFWAHRNQQRKYTGEPYIIHPMQVAGLVASVPGATPEMVAAAMLHDTVEDTRDLPAEDRVVVAAIEQQIGPTVALYVDFLSDMSTPLDGNRVTRKLRERERLASAPPQVQTIKYADLISNTSSIAALDPKFARVYLPEKRAVLEIVNKGDPGLLDLAWATLEQAEQILRALPERQTSNRPGG